MAKKEPVVSLIDTFSEFKELKNIDRTTMVSVLEETFRSVIAKMFGTDENYDVIVNPDKGDFEIWRNREVVADENMVNPNKQISLTEARKIDASYEIGEEVTDEVIFEKFGRRAILNLRQTLASKILELEKDSLYNKYIDKVGAIIAAEVYQIWKKEILLLDDEGNESALLLGKHSKIQIGFRYRFYFKKTQRLTLGSEYFDSALSSDCFLGFEELGELEAAGDKSSDIPFSKRNG